MKAIRNGATGLALLFAIFLTLAAGQQKDKKDADEPVFDLTADISPPKLVKQVNPEYPPDWKGVRVEGSVGIGVVVTSQGTPKDATVVKSLSKDLDQFAVDAVKQWRFAAARKGGKPVAVRILIEIEYHSM
jgi:periplasmic protein TonB